MLQIVSGKFFKSGRCFKTRHRGIYFTNYRAYSDVALVTPIGRLLPSTRPRGPVATFTYQLLEKLEWQPLAPGVMTSTGVMVPSWSALLLM